MFIFTLKNTERIKKELLRIVTAPEFAALH
jgi:hypothetical protein